MKEFLRTAAVAGGIWLSACICSDVIVRLDGCANYKGIVAETPDYRSANELDFFGNASKKDYTYYLINVGYGIQKEELIAGTPKGLKRGDRVKVSTPFLAGPFRPCFPRIKKVR